MLTALAMAAVLGGAPAQPADLKLTNVRTTVGELGPTREVSKLLPGDILFIAYDVEGLTIDPLGLAQYSMMMEVSNAAGTRVLPPATEKAEPRELSEFVPLRGNKVPARAYVTAGLDMPAGNYTCKVTVTDLKTKATASLNMKFEVAKKDFGIVAVYTSHDSRGELSAPTTGQVGQTIYIQFSIASFERDPKTKQPDVELEFQIFDAAGAATLPTPRKHIQDAKSAQQVKETDGAFALQFPLFMNRPGKFTVEMKATDRVSKKTFTYKLPVTVNPAN
ncbi:MAG: hypothetical protein J0I06_20375 [Planctomycetes bacterium]|nr:hypothetical protein [Planctomycetota bacterium]